VSRAAAELGGLRTGLFIPLRRNDLLLGHISASRTEVRPFTDKQIALLQNFAAQAVIAMENARLLTETREALEQQTATAEVLQVINASPGDLAPVFDTILRKARLQCDAIHGDLWTYDGECIHLAATHGEPGFSEWLRRQGPHRPPSGSLPGRVIRGEHYVHIEDVLGDPSYFPGPVFREQIKIAGIRTALFVALRKEDVLLGLIVVYRREVRPFTDKQIALLQNFAAQAVIAMENARLITETREALEQQTATAEVLQVINSSPGDLAPVFDAILEKATQVCEAVFGTLSIWDGERFHWVASRGLPTELVEALQQPLPPVGDRRPVADRIVRGEMVISTPDLREEEYRGVPVAQAFLRHGARSCVTVALRKEERLLGLITIYREEVRPFSDKQIALLQNFAAQAVIAMENARLITETQEALEQQTATAEVLQVINASPGDLTPVFDKMLERATSLCDAAFGVLWIVDASQVRAAASHAVPAAYRDFLASESSSPGPNSGVAQTIRAKSVLHFSDVASGEAYRSGDPFAVAAVELGGVRTLLNAPLIKDGNVLGILAIYRKEVTPFSDKQIALLQNFAAQAVIAMENARLLTETREALEQQTATAEVLRVINSSPGDLAPIFGSILEKALSLCDVGYGCLRTYDGKLFHPVADRGNAQFSEIALGWEQFEPLPGSPPARIASGEAVVQIADLVANAAREPGNPRARALVEIGGARTAIWVAMRNERQLLGYITAYRQEAKPFTEKQIALLQSFAAQAVIAMENARLLGELRQRTDEVAELNRGLEARVTEQVEELGRVGRLKRFLAPQLAELIVSQGDEKILESHRREIVVVFCDLRGYTAFTETAEPEEVLDFLREYHGALGPLVSQFEGTLDQFSGDGIMVFFNDPMPCPNPAERAVKMAMAMRETAGKLIAHWRERGRDLGFGAGIAQGYATLGQIGFSERSGYTAIGTVCNVAARLCAEAKDGQILLSQLVNVALKGSVATEQLGPLALKGLTQPVVAYNVPLAAIQPALRVIEGGPPSV